MEGEDVLNRAVEAGLKKGCIERPALNILLLNPVAIKELIITGQIMHIF